MKKNINYFIERAENDLNNEFNFDEDNFDCIIYELKGKNEEYEPITWEELKDELISNGWYYDDNEDAFYCDEYVEALKSLESIDDED